jgi:hypothetical protein
MKIDKREASYFVFFTKNNVVRVVKARRLRWAGSIQFMLANLLVD